MRIFKTFFILHALFIVMTTDDSRNIKQKCIIFRKEKTNVFRASKFLRKKGELRRSLTLVNALFARKKLGSHLFRV